MGDPAVTAIGPISASIPGNCLIHIGYMELHDPNHFSGSKIGLMPRHHRIDIMMFHS
jgi:hypothetical protein